MIAINIKRSRDDFAVAEHIDRFFFVCCIRTEAVFCFSPAVLALDIWPRQMQIRELCMTVMATSYKCFINMGFRLD